MRLFDIFRRAAPVRDAQELADFIDRNAAFVVQKGIYEYSRARAGHYAKVLFREPEFQAAAEQSRWRAYPLGLALVAELVEGVLRPAAVENRQPQADALNALVISVFDRYRTPALDRTARGVSPTAETCQPPSCEARDGYSRAVRRELFRDDADPR